MEVTMGVKHLTEISTKNEKLIKWVEDGQSCENPKGFSGVTVPGRSTID
jgi:hypothetical protein